MSTDSRKLSPWVMAALLALAGRHVLGGVVTASDLMGDACPRRTDAGANGPLDLPVHALPDLVEWKLGTWQPSDPQGDLFSGNWSNNGEWFRLNLVFNGVVNPPGPIGCCGQPAYEPFRYGPNPVSGYVEFDMDANPDTGGEIDVPDLSYLGVVARFGGAPVNAVARSRMAVDARAFDASLLTAPFVERSGEDFHFELVGWEAAAATFQRSDSSDWLFGPGETWKLTGHFLHRAHGYAQFSSTCCRSGVPLGNYEPVVTIRFSHAADSNRTTVSLVYPLINDASGDLTGQPAEPKDIFYTNQNSISEALWELRISAISATPQDRAMPEFALLSAWQDTDPDDCLAPDLWGVRILVGGSYTTAQDTPFAWSDVYPDVVIGDVDGDLDVDAADLAAFDAYLQANDGNPALDLDGTVNGSIAPADFGHGFSLYDMNYDGLIDRHDRALAGGPVLPIGDFDLDNDLDVVDFAHVQSCLTASGEAAGPTCRDVDLNHDGVVDDADVLVFVSCARGPDVPADPQCARN